MELRTLDMSDADAFRASKLTIVASNFERISDHAINIIEYRERLENHNEKMSESANKDMRVLGEKSVKSVELCIQIFSKENFALLAELERNENLVDRIHAEITDKHVDLERCSDNALNIATALRARKRNY